RGVGYGRDEFIGARIGERPIVVRRHLAPLDLLRLVAGRVVVGVGFGLVGMRRKAVVIFFGRRCELHERGVPAQAVHIPPVDDDPVEVARVVVALDPVRLPDLPEIILVFAVRGVGAVRRVVVGLRDIAGRIGLLYLGESG